MAVAGMVSIFCVVVGLWINTGRDKSPERESMLDPFLPIPPRTVVPRQAQWQAQMTGVICAQIIRLGHFFFGYRDYLFPVVFLLMAVTTQPAFPFRSERWDHWMDVLGFMVVLAGQGCRALAIGCVQNVRRGGQRKRISAELLIRTGFFAHSRNPLYLGNLLIFCGLVIIANSYWWYVLAFPGFVGMYWAIVLAEEEFLTKQFGHEYTDYCGQVNRFVPRLVGLRCSLTVSPFDWRRVVRKEAQVVCSWFTLVIVMLIWERVEQFGVTASRAETEILLLILLAFYAVYGVILWFKRKGMLHPGLPSGENGPGKNKQGNT